MRRVLLLAGLLLASALAHAQVTSTRETAYDWACCEDAACATKTNHQRLDVAFTACLNKSMADGKTRWVQGGRYRVAVSLPTPPPPPPPPPPSGAEAVLSWQAPTLRTDGSALTNLAGYRIRYGNSVDSYPNTVTVSNPATLTYTVTPLASGTWYFVLTAYDGNGLESAQTAAVNKTIP